MPTHAPNLWVIRPGSSLPYSRSMHADHPLGRDPSDSSLSQWLFNGGAYYRVPTPHARIPRELGLSLLVTGCGLKTTFLIHFNCWGAKARGLHTLPWCRPLLGLSYLWALGDSFLPRYTFQRTPPCWLWSTPEASQRPRTGRYSLHQIERECLKWSFDASKSMKTTWRLCFCV